MRDKNVKRLVVMQNGKIVGIISESDLIKIEPALHILIKEHSQWDIADIPGSPASVIPRGYARNAKSTPRTSGSWKENWYARTASGKKHDPFSYSFLFFLIRCFLLAQLISSDACMRRIQRVRRQIGTTPNKCS
jgi:hypothetical protein